MSAQYAQLPGVTGSVGTTIHESRNDASGPVLSTSPSNVPGQSDVAIALTTKPRTTAPPTIAPRRFQGRIFAMSVTAMTP